MDGAALAPCGVPTRPRPGATVKVIATASAGMLVLARLQIAAQSSSLQLDRRHGHQSVSGHYRVWDEWFAAKQTSRHVAQFNVRDCRMGCSGRCPGSCTQVEPSVWLV